MFHAVSVFTGFASELSEPHWGSIAVNTPQFFAVVGIRFWNILPADLRQPDIELVSFRRLIVKIFRLSVTVQLCFNPPYIITFVYGLKLVVFLHSV